MKAMPDNQTSAHVTETKVANSENGTFALIYCRQNKCSPDKYEGNVFWDCLNHPLMTPVVWLIFRIQSNVFSLDTNLINLVSQTANFNDFRNTVEEYDGFDRLHPENNFFRRTLKLRISRRKLIALGHQAFGQSWHK